jgi:hypothetical protein
LPAARLSGPSAPPGATGGRTGGRAGRSGVTWPTAARSDSEPSSMTQEEADRLNARGIARIRHRHWREERGIPNRVNVDSRAARARRHYRRLKVRAGVEPSLDAAIRHTFRTPGRARYGLRMRDALGRYLPSAGPRSGGGYGSPASKRTPGTRTSNTAAEAV